MLANTPRGHFSMVQDWGWMLGSLYSTRRNNNVATAYDTETVVFLSGVSSLSISNHLGSNSMRRRSRMAMFVTRAITASPRAILGWQRGMFLGSGLRMHQAQC